MTRSRRAAIAPAMLAVLAVLASCAAHAPVAPVPAPARDDGTVVEIGPIVQSDARDTLDVLIPADGDLHAALELARARATAAGVELVDALPARADRPVATAQIVDYAEERWDHELPAVVVSVVDRGDFDRVDRSSGVIRIDARAPAGQAWELARSAIAIAREVAAPHAGWIYDRDRVQLHDARTLGQGAPDPARPDVRSIMRTMTVSPASGGLEHLHTFGLRKLGHAGALRRSHRAGRARRHGRGRSRRRADAGPERPRIAPRPRRGRPEQAAGVVARVERRNGRVGRAVDARSIPRRCASALALPIAVIAL